MNSICRSCGAEIIWIRMASGKMMPVNARPIAYDPAALSDKDAMTLVTASGKVEKGHFNPGACRIGYTSHFATCPAAASHRKK